MTDILLCGCSGKMGKAVAECVEDRDEWRIIAGVDLNAEGRTDFPVFSSPAEFSGKANVLIDFSHPTATAGNLEYAVKTRTPAVIATTGLNDTQMNLIKTASLRIPVFFSANFSVGVSLLKELAQKAAKVLGESFDIEIIEKHHNTKIDAPSGTAIMLAETIAEELPERPRFIYDRHLKREPRSRFDIGIHSIRGGTITGEHEIIFAGHDETITISHNASSKRIFAAGALNAAWFIKNKPPGLYTMKELVSD